MKRWLLFLERLVQALFDPQTERGFKALGPLWIAGLIAVGGGLWAKFLNFGNIPFDFLDWAEVSGPRLAFIRDAMLKGVLPLHMNDTSALRGLTDRFMTIPDVILSPQIILMRFMDVGHFVLVNTLLLYLIGSLGLLWFRRRYSLSLIAFTILFLLFNFNGHILAHFSVGHANWGGYFLFSWLAVLTIRLLDGDHSWRWVALTALLLFFILINGAFHQFVWALIFLGLLGIVVWKHFTTVLKTLVAAILLGMVRLLPPVLNLGQFNNDFITGYTTLTHLIWAMVLPVNPWDVNKITLPFSTVSWWEFDLFVGILGTLFILFFGIFRWLVRRTDGAVYPALLLPLLGMVVLSMGRVYNLIMLLPIPLLNGERVSSRIISLPFVFLLILAAIEFQRWLDGHRQPLALRLAALLLLGIQISDMWLYIKLWQVSNVYPNYPQVPVDLAAKVVANHPDPVYTNILWIGAAVSLVTLIGLVILAFKKK